MGIDTKPTMQERVVAARKTKAVLKRKPGVGEAIELLIDEPAAAQGPTLAALLTYLDGLFAPSP